MPDYILLESGDVLLLESGDKALLESGVEYTLDALVVDVVLDDVLPTYSTPELVVEVVLDTIPFTVDALAVDVVLSDPLVGIPTTANPYGDPRYRVRLVSVTGVGVGEFPSARVDSVTWTLNDIDDAMVTISCGDPMVTNEFFTVDACDDYEIQVWRDGDLLLWGPIVRAREYLADQTVELQVFSPWWYWTRRFVGDPDRPNFITNGGFEDASTLTGWGTQGSVTATIDTVTVNEGARSLKLVSGAGAYVWQQFVYRHDYPPGLILRLAAYWRIAAAGASPAENLAAELIITDESTGLSYRNQILIDDDDPRGGWNRDYCDLLVGPGINWKVEVRLYGTSGTIYWDSVQTVRDEAPISTLYPGEDQTVIARKIIEYGQDPGVGQSWVNVGTDCPASGVVIDVGYTEGDHRWLADIMSEQIARENAYDWSISYTPATRTFTTHYPERGSTRTEHRLELGRQVITGTVEVDRSQQANSAVVLGDTPSFDREEGGATDFSSSTIVLQKLERASIGTPVRFLDQLAAEIVDQSKQLPVLPTFTVSEAAGDLIHVLEVGDSLPVRITEGWSKPTGDYRITSMTLRPGLEVLDLTFAAVPS